MSATAQTQQNLWHDTPEQALRSAVDALGGFKRVGSEIWPALPADAAGRKLSQCLDDDRPEKLSLSELCMVLRMARTKGIHVAAAFLMTDAGYADPVPVDPETEKEKLQREFIAATAALSQMASRIQTLAARA